MLLQKLFIVLIVLPSLILGSEPSESKLKVIYNSLDPTSITQHLAFYDLYGHKPIGQRALSDLWQLLSGNKQAPQVTLKDLALSPSLIASIVALIYRPQDQELPLISEEDLNIIENLAARLAHVRLKGHYATTEEEIIHLPSEQIDLARGLFLSQFAWDPQKIRVYEAIIDLMALQVLARLPPSASSEDKIRAINHFIFKDMGFRFPPHSLYAKDIDLYTFLPSVIDSRRGVCLGVSILYLCIAQRLDLPLEMITPPGHIYIRYRTPTTTINIETTARGIHVDSEDYLSMNTCDLQQRTIKEVIGLAHVNHAAVFWQKESYEPALEAYYKALPYLADDPLLKELMGYTYLFLQQEEEGRRLLLQVKDYLPSYAVVKETMIDDYLQGATNAEAIRATFKHVDETRASILEKKQLLEEVVKSYPRFRAGVLQLATTWLQLHRLDEALETLQYHHTLDPYNPESNYYLAVIYSQRRDYNHAWEHLRQAKVIVQDKDYDPKILKELRQDLILCCPE